MAKPQFIYWRTVLSVRCGGCGARTWHGPDDDIMAWPAVVDADAFLTHEGERRAIIKGRETWRFEPGPPRRIWLRDRWHRQALKAGELNLYRRPLLVVVQHVCGRPVPEWAMMDPPAPKQKRLDSEEPPF